MTVRKKAAFSLIISAFLLAGIAAYCVLVEKTEIPAFFRHENIILTLAFFLTVFLALFFILNIKQSSKAKNHRRRDESAETVIFPEPEEIKTNGKNSTVVTAGKGGLLAAAASLAVINPVPVDFILERNGIHYINSDLINNDENTGGKLDGNFVKLVDSVVNQS